jgi:hypothetical protein
MIAYFGSYKMLRTWNVSEVEPDATIFDSHSRFIVEHALETKSREGGVRK